MGCSVCIGTDDYDPPEFYHLETRKARTAKTCRECGRVISSGEQYEHVRAKWNGKIGTVNTCSECAEIRNVFSCESGYVHGSLWEDMTQIAFPDLTTATDCFQQLSAKAKEFVLVKWREWKFAEV